MNSISLKYKISLIIFLLEAVMVSLILWQTTKMSRTEINTQIHEREKTLSSLLAGIGRFSLINEEYAELQTSFEKTGKDPFVNLILLTDYQDTVVASSSSQLIGSKGPVSKDSKNSYRLTEQITNPTGLLGTLTIEFSATPLDMALEKGRKRGIAIALVSMVVIAFLGIVSGFLLTRRIGKLAESSRAMADGNLDISLEIKGTDEIAMLAADFHKMSSNLGQTINNLRESESRYHNLFKHNHSVMLIINPDTGDIADCNPAACSFYGYDYNELTQKKIFDINQLSYTELAEEIKRARLEERNHSFSKHTLHDGTVKDVEVYSGPLRITGQEMLYSIIHDISGKKEIENELRKSKEEWERTFDSISDIITIQDKEMRIVRANRTARVFFENESQALIGTPCFKIFRGISEPCARCPGVSVLQDIHDHSEIIEHKKLGKFFHVTSSPILDKNNQVEYLVHVAKDITAQKKLEAELFQAQKMEAIGTLAGGIAHDFNNILSAIIGFSELIKLDLPADSKAHADIRKVLIAGKRAADLVKQILAFSRKSSQKIQPLSPHLVIKEAVKMLRSSLPTTITINEDIADCGKIMADPTSIHQIILNLCTNAQHAMENEKGTLTVRLYRSDRGPEESVNPQEFIVLTVSDTGHGMNKEVTDRIFEPYFTTKELGKGTGLGLAVVHGIVQEYKGFIKVESERGKGTTLHIFLPAISSEDEFAAFDEAQPSLELPGGTERIMVIDDEPLIANMNLSVLQGLGYKVTAVTESTEALEIFSKNPEAYDLIITDQTMPGLSGAELARKILSIKPAMPVIICTGYSSVLKEKDALAIGIKKYLRKPLTRKDLAEAVRSVLDEKNDPLQPA